MKNEQENSKFRGKKRKLKKVQDQGGKKWKYEHRLQVKELSFKKI